MLALVTLSSIQQGRRSAKLQMVLVRPEQMQMMAGASRPEFVPVRRGTQQLGWFSNAIAHIHHHFNPPPPPPPAPPWNSHHYIQPQTPYIPPPEPPFVAEPEPLGFEAGTGGHAETEEEMMSNPRSVYHNALDDLPGLGEKKGDNAYTTTEPVEPDSVDPWVWSIGHGVYRAPEVPTLYQRPRF